MMGILDRFNLIKKIFSILLIICFFLPLSRCDMQQEHIPVHQSEASIKAKESNIEKHNDFYLTEHCYKSLQELVGGDWESLETLFLTFFCIFFPLCLWRISEKKSAIFLLVCSPIAGFAVYLYVWVWPVQLFGGYLLTLLWILLFLLSILFFLKNRLANSE